MGEKPSDPKKQTPEDVAQIYSQARGPGSRYLGYSASRREVQGRFRDRIERAHAERAGVEPAGVLAHPATGSVRAAHFQGATGISSEAGFKQPMGGGPISTPQEHPLQEHPLAVPREREKSPDSFPSPEAPALPLSTVALPPGFELRPPAVVIFSLAGRIGKTCLVASLGRAVSASGERVLLAETAAGGLLASYFGSHPAKPGLARTFATGPLWASGLNGVRDWTPVTVLNVEAECFPQFESGQDLLLGKLVQESSGHSRMLIDVATAGDELSRLLLLQPLVLVPILPEVNSIAALQPLESLLVRPGPDGEQAEVFYLLNQFDASSGLHQELREMLQQRLGDRLLPLMIRKSSAVSEALSEGMTMLDYDADSGVAEDYRELAEWLRRVQAPAAYDPARTRQR